VFFFLAEYGSILLMCILTSILFLGGYLPWFDLIYWFDYINNILAYVFDIDWVKSTEYISMRNAVIRFSESGLFYGIILGSKSAFLVFVFIWVRASFPRIRFDQLMSFCWTVLLPLLFAFIVFVPCTLYAFDALFLSPMV
jgi:NADH-ubiquinone oxidoreductase chain 1